MTIIPFYYHLFYDLLVEVIQVRDCRQILLLKLSEFKRIPPKIIKKHDFLMISGGKEVCSSLLSIRTKIWRLSHKQKPLIMNHFKVI